MNPQLRRILIAGAAATAGVFIVVYGIVFWLGTDSGSRFLLARVQDAAAGTPGVGLEWKEARLAPFSGISFSDLRVKLDRDGSKLEVTLPRFELRYDLSLLGRSLVIETLTVERPSITGTLAVPPPSTEPQPASEPLDWNQLRELVLNPPLSVELKEAKLVDPRIDLRVRGDATTVPVDGSIRLGGTNGSMSFAWVPGKMTGRADFEMKPGASRIQLKLDAAKSPAHSDSLSFEPQARFNGAFRLETPEQQAGAWRFDVRAEKNSAGLRNFAFARTFADGKTRPWNVRFSEQLLEWSAGATEQKITLESALKGDAISASLERPMPAVRPGFDLKLETTPDLSRFSQNGSFTLNGVPLARAEATGGIRGDSANADFTLRFHSDSRLAPLSTALKGMPSIDAGFSGTIAAKLGESLTASLSKLQGSFEGQTFLTGDVALDSGAHAAGARGELTFQPVSAFFAFVKKMDSSFTLPVAEKSLLSMRARTEFDARQVVEGTKTTSTWKGKTVVSGLGPLQDARIEAPMEFTHEAAQTLEDGSLPVIEASLGGNVPKLAYKHEVEAEGSRFALNVRMKGAEKPAIQAGWKLSQDSVSARDPKSGKWIPLKGATGEGRVEVSESGRLTAEGIRFRFHESLLSFEASATGDVNAGKIEARGEAALKIPKGFPVIAGSDLGGSAVFPWRLQVRNQREIQFDGEAVFKSLSWGNGGFGFSGLTGRIPVSEALIREGDSIQFARLEVPNAFERVDFERFQPFLQEAAQTELREIRYEGRKIGPLFGFFSLRQNLMSVHQFDFRLGTRGRAYGEFYLDANPAQLQMGVLSRVSELDLEELLPVRMLKNSPGGSKKLAGRMGMVMNLTRSTVDGRMDITEIGGAQLVTMIRALDPKGKDEKLNRARSALGLAYPTFVGMSFGKGLMDMSVSMSAPVPGMTIRGIPIAGMVATEFAPVRELLASGSVKSESR